jgi:DNA-binding protein YbaB
MPVDDELDRAEAWIDNLSASVTEQAAKAQAMSQQVADLQVSAESPDGSVLVTVSGSGAVTNLRLGEATRKRPADETAAEILSVMRRAQAKLVSQVADIAAATVGSDSAAGRAVVASFEQRFTAESWDDAEAGGSSSDWRRHAR